MNTPSDSDPTGRPIDDALAIFIDLHQAGTAPDPETFAAGYPDDIRSEIAHECRQYLEDARVIPSITRRRELPDQIGPYRLTRELGYGGMATVYAAIDTRDHAERAVKVLHPHLSKNTKQIKRLKVEYTVGSNLEHPNLVSLIEFSEADDAYYIVMSEVMKDSVADRLPAAADDEDETPSRRPIELLSAVDIAIDVCAALEHLHENGVVHRDVKPHNILLDTKDVAHLADFGLATITDKLTEQLTAPGQQVGTPFYMSPEQARATRYGVDARSDIYSLGVVMYEMLTNRRPFEGDSRDKVLYDICFSKVQNPSRYNPRIPTDLETICLKALQKSPSDRYASARDMADDLRRFKRLEAIAAKRPPLRRAIVGFVRRHKIATAIVLSSLITGSLLVAHRMWSDYQARIARMPKLTVVTDPPGCAVYIRRYDRIMGTYGPPEKIGVTPLERVPLEVHRYRIVTISADGKRFAEQTRSLLDNRTWTLQPVLTDARSVTGMVALVGKAASLQPYEPFGGQAAELPRFYLDKHEVTNREYKEYLDTVGGEMPTWWKGTYDPAIANKPVVGISWSNAQQYAEWKGKRLPTRLEWALAAGRTKYPWGDDNTNVERRSCVRRWDDAVAGPDERAAVGRMYVRFCADVGSFPDDRTAEGIHDLLGSVREFVDAVRLENAPYGLETSPQDRYAAGSSWRQSSPSLADLELAPAWLPVGSLEVGFRCAKSAAPLSSTTPND